MQIRLIPRDGLDSLLVLYRHLHRADEPLPDAAMVRSVWEELCSNPRYRCLGGYVGSELVASCTLTVIANLTRGCRPYGIVENVVTHTEHRRRGYGKAMLAHALAEAWTSGCYKVMLLTGRKDDATRKFYEAAGFDAHEKQGFVAKPPR